MEGPSGVIALVLAEVAVGSAALLWLTGLWGTVRRGFFILVGSVVLGCMLLAVLAGSTASTDEVRLAVILGVATSALLGISLGALILRWDAVGLWSGIASVPIGVATLVALARPGAPALPSAITQLIVGAAFMGAVTAGLLLGHWYLVDRRLSREPIQLYTNLLIVAVVLEAAAVGFLGFGAGGATEGFSPFLAIAGLSTWLALGMIACTGLISVMIRATLRTPRTRAVQAATGFFYLAVITAFTAELAAKVGFFG